MAGILLGAVVGVLPGLGVANGVAILPPLTFGMSPSSAIILLAAIYWGGLFGIGEILLTVEEDLKMDGVPSGMSVRTLDTLKEMPRYWRTLIRGALIGCWMGIKPGVVADTWS